jgi:DNA polymerase III sliding clamp (beta) subunit (PCNA family)
MKIHAKIKIEAACEDEKGTRDVLKNPYLEVHRDGERANLVATNGKILAVIPVEPEPGDTSGHVPVDALKTARKGAKGDVSIGCNGAVTLPGGVTMLRPDEGEYPEWRQVLPDQNRELKIRIGLNISLLKDLADAMGTEGLILEIADADQPVTVRPTGTGDYGNSNRPANPDAYGVIMPMRCSR